MKRLVMTGALLFAATLATTGTSYAQGSARPVLEKFIVTGVIIVDGGVGTVFLQEPNLTNNRVVAVRTGGRVGPYEVTGIFADRVELRGPEGTVLVPLQNGQSAPSGAVATAAIGPSPSGQTRAGGNPFAGNPTVHYIPVDDPHRSDPFPTTPRPVAPLTAKAPSVEKGTFAMTPFPQPIPQPSAQYHGSGVNPFANNPSVIYVPVDDPSRRSGFAELFSIPKRK
jgi:hypothetical protein